MPIYQKKPVKVPAVEFKPGMSAEDIKAALHYSGNQKINVTPNSFTVSTEWGDMTCKPGDYVCVGGSGMYTCEKEAFAKSYTPTSTPNVFAKKPVKIVAFQWNGESPEVVGKALDVPASNFTINGDIIRVKTIDSDKPLEYTKGTFIAKGVKGEVYGISKDEFPKIYTLVENRKRFVDYLK